MANRKRAARLCAEVIAIALAVAVSTGRSARAAADDRAAIAKASEADRQQMMQVLGIKELRPGANGRDLNAPRAANYDEAKADTYGPLPDALTLGNGEKVRTAGDWWHKRRPELVELFDREIYGRVPRTEVKVQWTVVSKDREKVGQVFVETRRLRGHVDNPRNSTAPVNIELSLSVPERAKKPVPVVMELIFNPPPGFRMPATNGDAEGPSWQEQVASRGWAFATLTPVSIQADNGAGLNSGIIGLMSVGTSRKPEDWGALRAWAWGASRALDYFSTDTTVDAKRVAIAGHSRYGKAALVAMAYDQRFSNAYISSSGEAGAKLYRRHWGELVENIAATSEYHWMAGNFLKYAGPLTTQDLPIDAHELIALCAPRPVFIGAGATDGDGWADAKGMFLAEAAASPVYELLGARGLTSREFPPMETDVTNGDLAFRQHRFGHTQQPNWAPFLKFAGRYWDNPGSQATKPPAGAMH